MTILNVIDWGEKKSKIWNVLFVHVKGAVLLCGLCRERRQPRSAYEETLPPTGSSRRCAAHQPPPHTPLTDRAQCTNYTRFVPSLDYSEKWITMSTNCGRSLHSLQDVFAARKSSSSSSICGCRSLTLLLPTEVHRPRQLSEKLFSPHDSHIDVLPDWLNSSFTRQRFKKKKRKRNRVSPAWRVLWWAFFWLLFCEAPLRTGQAVDNAIQLFLFCLCLRTAVTWCLRISSSTELLHPLRVTPAQEINKQDSTQEKSWDRFSFTDFKSKIKSSLKSAQPCTHHMWMHSPESCLIMS